MRNYKKVFPARLEKTQAPLKKVTKYLASCQTLKICSELKFHFLLIMKNLFKREKESLVKSTTFNMIENEEFNIKNRETPETIKIMENIITVKKCKDVTNVDLEMKTDSNKIRAETTNEARVINKIQENKDNRPHGIISQTINYGQDSSLKDVFENDDKKMEYLYDENMRLVGDIKANDQVGQELVNWIQEIGTEAEVRKLLTHISQVEQVANLLVLLTMMLARAENTESRDQVLLKTKGKIAKQLKDAEHLRQYTINQGNVLRHMVSKYSKDFWPRFERFLEVKVGQIVKQRQLKEELCTYEQTKKIS